MWLPDPDSGVPITATYTSSSDRPASQVVVGVGWVTVLGNVIVGIVAVGGAVGGDGTVTVVVTSGAGPVDEGLGAIGELPGSDGRDVCDTT